jgi:hypothetical protein
MDGSYAGLEGPAGAMAQRDDIIVQAARIKAGLHGATAS